MTAPTYSRPPHRHIWRTRIGRWDWEITDGIGGATLDTGHTWTRAGADVDSTIAQALCVPSFGLRLEWAADRLRREGLPVLVRVDEQDRVCVRPLCPCSTRDEVRVLAAFLALTGAVLWVPETDAPARWAGVS